MGLIIGGVPPHGLILDGQSVSLYAGGSPPVKVWPTIDVVQITLGTGTQARDQFRAALTARGLDYATVTELPFDIELVGSGEALHLFYGCRALTTIPPLDTSQVTNMNGMFQECFALTTIPPLDTSNVTNAPAMFAYCRSLTSVPAMDTSQMTNARSMFNGCSSLTSVPDLDAAKMVDVAYMFVGCSALTDGNVRLMNKNPNVTTTGMINNSGLTREPWYKADGTPDDPTEVVQITLGAGIEARNQFLAAMSDRGLDYTTVTEIPFEIDLVGTGSARDLFRGCAALTSVPPMDTSGVTNMRSMFNRCNALTSVPAMDTSQVTNMAWMFTHCYALTSVPAMDTSKVTTMNNMFDYCLPLTYVPDMDTSQVTNMNGMFLGCAALTDGNVRLIGRHPQVDTTDMITGSGLTREPFYTTDGQPWPTAEVHEVTITNATGTGTAHPLLTVTVPAGETWSVRIQGTITKAAGGNAYWPFFRIGTANSGTYGQGAAVDFSGTITPANSAIALVSNDFTGASFTGTVTIEK